MAALARAGRCLVPQNEEKPSDSNEGGMTIPDLTYSLSAAAQAQRQQEQATTAAREAAIKAAMAEAQRRLQAELDHAMWQAMNQRFRYEDVAYRGRPTLPPAARPQNHWSIVLGVSPAASKAEINKAYRAKAKLAHADAGGSDGAMVRLNLARDQAVKERNR